MKRLMSLGVSLALSACLQGAVCKPCEGMAVDTGCRGLLYCTACGKRIPQKDSYGVELLRVSDGYGLICDTHPIDVWRKPIYCELCGKKLSPEDSEAAEYAGVLREAFIKLAVLRRHEPNDGPLMSEEKVKEFLLEKVHFRSASAKDRSDMMARAKKELALACKAERTAEYVEILRKTYAVETDGVVGVDAQKAIDKKRALFLSASDKKQADLLAKARQDLEQTQGRSEAKRKLKDAVSRANGGALANRGRSLYVGIMLANEDRKGGDRSEVWPKSTLAKDADTSDISGKLFKTSTDYFTALFDLKNIGQEGWNPYVKFLDDPKGVFDKDTGRSKWIVAKGVVNELSDCVPVLVSANVDTNSLICKSGTYDPKELTGSVQFTGDNAVVVTKGGSALVINKRYRDFRFVYFALDEKKIVIPEGFGYLCP